MKDYIKIYSKLIDLQAILDEKLDSCKDIDLTIKYSNARFLVVSLQDFLLTEIREDFKGDGA